MLNQIVVSLALEGVPVRAIARATALPAHDVREVLVEARNRGEIIQLPRDDWPPGQGRDYRLPATVNGVPLHVVVAARIKIRGQAAAILLLLLRYGTVTFEQLIPVINTRTESTEKQIRLVHVVVFKLRSSLVKLGYGTKESPAVRAVWGQGYEMLPAVRDDIMKRLDVLEAN